MSDIVENKTEATENIQAMQEEARTVVFEEALEAILFAAGHPISYSTLARVFESTPAQMKDKVIEYSRVYNNHPIPRGVILLTFADSCQLCTKKYYLNEIREALGIKKSGTLSSSSMEALAIVAYNQPVTRVFVDTLRRVDSSYAMNNLIDRGLIESKGRLDAPGRPMLYGTTPDFLRAFGLSTIDALPRTAEEIKEMFARLDRAGNAAEDEQISMFDDNVLELASPSEESAPIAEQTDVVEAAEETAEAISDTYDEPSAEDDIIIDDM